MLLTAIASPEVLLIVLVIVLVGTGIMTSVVRKKYECTPEREEEWEEALSQGLIQPPAEKKERHKS